MTQDMKKEPIIQIGSDKMISRHVCDKPFMTSLTEVNEKRGFNPTERGEEANLVHRWL
jgi:hypothetical protein